MTVAVLATRVSGSWLFLSGCPLRTAQSQAATAGQFSVENSFNSRETVSARFQPMQFRRGAGVPLSAKRRVLLFEVTELRVVGLNQKLNLVGVEGVLPVLTCCLGKHLIEAETDFAPRH